MSGHPVSAGDRADAAQFKHELLGHLGLRDDASEQDIEAAHYVLVEFLELVPNTANSWASARTADMDEAFALLSGPERALVSASQRAYRVQRRRDETPERPTAVPTAAMAPIAPTTRKPRRNQIMGAVGVVLAAGGFGLFQMSKASEAPSISGAPTGQQSTTPNMGSSTVPIDHVKVAALLAKTRANPKDTTSLQTLGDIYFAAADYRSASAWDQKVLGVDPKNQEALLAIGAAQFHLGNAVEAKKQWLVAAGLYPKSAEVHYDLGFLYFSQTPPDTVRMTAEWRQVIAIDPSSAIAQSVATHLKSSTTPGAK